MTPELEAIHRTSIEIPCPRCEAPIDARCVNLTTGLKSHLPCLVRVKALDEIGVLLPLPVESPTISTDVGDDQWLYAHLSTRPQSIAKLATQLDASTGTIETALARLEWAGHVQCHPHQDGTPDEWTTKLRRAS